MPKLRHLNGANADVRGMDKYLCIKSYVMYYDDSFDLDIFPNLEILCVIFDGVTMKEPLGCLKLKYVVCVGSNKRKYMKYHGEFIRAHVLG